MLWSSGVGTFEKFYGSDRWTRRKKGSDRWTFPIQSDPIVPFRLHIVVVKTLGSD